MHHKKESLKRVRESPLPISKKPCHRGRPRVEWTVSRQRRLLRLYLNTPESSLPLEQILSLLKEGTFNPKERQTQALLQSLLSKSYKQRRPGDREQMKIRVDYLRSHLKPRATIADIPNEQSSIHDSPSTNFAPNLSISRRSSITNPKDHIHNYTLPVICFATSIPNFEPTQDISPQTTSNSTEAPSGIDQSLEAAVPKNFKNSAYIHEDRMSFVRSILPGRRTSSFLADVVSLFSGLSLRSSFQSSACESWRSSSRPQSSPWRNSNKSELLRSRFFRKVPISLQSRRLLPGQAREDYFFGQRSSADHSILATFCCSRRNQESLCIHQQLSHIIVQGSPNAAHGGDFFTQVDELNMRDPMGNCLIHHAARWGAKMDIIIGIARQTNFERVTNYRSETFLHLLAPNTDSLTRDSEVRSFTKLIDLLKARLFNFCIIDDTGRSILRRLLLRPEFSWKAILILLEGVRSEVIRSWTSGDQSGHLAKDILARTQHDGGQSFALALQTQHLIDSSSVQIAHRENFYPGNLMCRTYTSVRRGNVLHRVIAMLNRTNKWVVTCCPWELWHRRNEDDDDAYRPLNFDDGLKAIINTPGYRTCVNEKELHTNRTPLMSLLIEFGCGSLQDDELQAACVSVLLDAGASLDACDSLGNTPVHYAAALELSPALKVFLNHRARLEWENSFGHTPKDLATSSLMFENTSNNPRGVKVVARLYEAIAVLS